MSAVRFTGERIVTNQGGFNPTWQRHTVNYRFAAAFLPRGTAVDLGCGTGPYLQILAGLAREVVGVDVAPAMIEEATRNLPAGLGKIGRAHV